jgi:hypothetical protein
MNMDAPLTARPLRIAAVVRDERRQGPTRHGLGAILYDVAVVRLTGEGVDARAEINDDGEVAELTGTYPVALHRALTEIAELASGAANPAWGDAQPETVWAIDAAGEVSAVEVEVATCGRAA